MKKLTQRRTSAVAQLEVLSSQMSVRFRVRKTKFEIKHETAKCKYSTLLFFNFECIVCTAPRRFSFLVPCLPTTYTQAISETLVCTCKYRCTPYVL
jgi:hypothetical protein